MRYLILPLVCILSFGAQAGAQTRRIAAASHSGAATERDTDNFGLDLQSREQIRQRYDSIRRRTDSVARADSAQARVRVKAKR